MNSIDIVKYLETKYPKTLAYEYDNVGLQVGSLNKKCQIVLVTLDVTKEVIQEAIALKADLIISHHPLIFKPLLSVATETPRGKIVADLLKNNIALYSAHTNYDLAEGGMNDELAKVLGIQNPQLLDEDERIGRWGPIQPSPIADYIAFVKRVLAVDNLRFVGKLEGTVKIVGVSGGSGSNHFGSAMKKNCDLYITGDVTYHTALDCLALGQNVLDVGHYAEKIFKKALQADLEKTFPAISFLVSKVASDPFQSL
jgi:dinuclear metal center YbgI/SA1388 family protein